MNHPGPIAQRLWVLLTMLILFAGRMFFISELKYFPASDFFTSPLEEQNLVCNNSINCSLNGCIDEDAICQCRPPWTGHTCSKLLTVPSPVSAKSLYNNDVEQYNSWSGPIIAHPKTSSYHMYMAIYQNRSLYHTVAMLYGTAKTIAGPYKWKSLNVTPLVKSPNPSFLEFKEGTKDRFAMFMHNSIWYGESIEGPFIEESGVVLVNDSSIALKNFKPILHNGMYYSTFQQTNRIYTSKYVAGPWTLYSNITVGAKVDLEDPELWIDEYGNWHILSHAYDKSQWYNCSSSLVSAHLYSVDGKYWHKSPEQPYGHVIEFTDNTSLTYATLERPYTILNSKRQLTHIVLAASLEIGDEGCAHTKDCTEHPRNRFCPCVNCKYLSPGGTVILTLDV
mmetsp:Transcript_13509/g.19925  ORF Transcript_13509/g.19925 Transcript_13509/m.19925 type:complete len:393 (+) Transcript_13509:87-1265(+)